MALGRFLKNLIGRWERDMLRVAVWMLVIGAMIFFGASL